MTTQNLDRFKFRAWVVRGVDYYNAERISQGMVYGIESLYDGNINGIIPEEQYEILGFYESFQELLENLNENIILMQSTGLKDKNGKLIYEGDVVKYTEGGFFLKGTIKIVTFEDYNTLINNASELEVIGNIYENPGLLIN